MLQHIKYFAKFCNPFFFVFNVIQGVVPLEKFLKVVVLAVFFLLFFKNNKIM